MGRVIGEDEYDDDGNYIGDAEFEGTPEGCLACGGDYPNCTSSCPLFDD